MHSQPRRDKMRSSCIRGSVPPRRKVPSRKWMFRISLLIAVFIISTIGFHSTSIKESNYNGNYHASRSLLSATPAEENRTCGSSSPHLPFWEQCHFECDHIPALWVVLYAICILILFIGLAIVCDEFFVPSLEAISEKLDLSEDVAGATFMAAGSSAPELFTSILGVSFNSDVGVGTIVGSAVFNILIIIALTAALAGKVLVLDPRPLLRDSTFYALSIICFILFSWDGQLLWWESLILLLLYALYITIMKFNTFLMEKVCIKRSIAPMDEEETKMEEVKNVEAGKPPAGGTDKAAPAQAADDKVHRKDSVHSRGSEDYHGSKHIFHHVKQGEFAHHFTSSQVDLRKALDDRRVSNLSLRKNANKSRPSSADSKQAMIVTVDNDKQRPQPNGDIYAISPVQEDGNKYNNNGETTTLKEVDSLGGDSTYGSQAMLLGPPNNNVDADSGIHSTQGLTPTIPSDPSFPSYTLDTDEQAKRHSIMVHVKPGDHHHDHFHQMDHKDSETTATTSLPDSEPAVTMEEEEELTLRPIPCFCAVNTYYPGKEGETGPWSNINLVLKWVLFFISFPFMCLFTWTIPNCVKPRFQKYYLMSFTMSIVWIAALSFVMVTFVAKVGCVLNIDHYTMGLVVVAIGTSVPDALSSVLVARDGFADMAVSNAIGSNVFDINLGLGLPYFIRACLSGFAPITLLTEYEVELRAAGKLPVTPHAKFGFILLLILGLTLFTFTCVRFRLNWIVGVTFLATYVAFLIYAFIQELVCDYNC